MPLDFTSLAGKALLLTTAVTFATAASAQQAPQDDSALRQNCVGDYFRYCAGYSPGSAEIRKCFATNTSRLTPECRDAIRAFDRRNGNPHS